MDEENLPAQCHPVIKSKKKSKEVKIEAVQNMWQSIRERTYNRSNRKTSEKTSQLALGI